MLAARRMMIDRTRRASTCLLSDNFNRTASVTTVNTASDGGTWIIYGGTWGISTANFSGDTTGKGFLVNTTSQVGNQPRIGSFFRIMRDLGKRNQDVTVTSDTLGNASPQLACITLACDPTVGSSVYGWYEIRFDPDASPNTIGVFRAQPSGVATQIGTNMTSTAWKPGSLRSTLRATYDGINTFTVYQDGTLLGTRTDSSPLTGAANTYCGLGLLAAGGGFDDFCAK